MSKRLFKIVYWFSIFFFLQLDETKAVGTSLQTAAQYSPHVVTKCRSLRLNAQIKIKFLPFVNIPVD